MNRKKLAKLRREIAGMRRRLGAIKGRELEDVARTLGRRLDTQRGKEPTWVSDELPHRNPVSIPRHGSRDLRPKTAGNILYQLELDLDELEEKNAND
jgi:hypothetical protein